jgi:hypothetical protein
VTVLALTLASLPDNTSTCPANQVPVNSVSPRCNLVSRDSAGPGSKEEQVGSRFNVGFVVGGGISMRFALD